MGEDDTVKGCCSYLCYHNVIRKPMGISAGSREAKESGTERTGIPANFDPRTIGTSPADSAVQSSSGTCNGEVSFGTCSRWARRRVESSSNEGGEVASVGERWSRSRKRIASEELRVAVAYECGRGVILVLLGK